MNATLTFHRQRKVSEKNNGQKDGGRCKTERSHSGIFKLFFTKKTKIMKDVKIEAFTDQEYCF